MHHPFFLATSFSQLLSFCPLVLFLAFSNHLTPSCPWFLLALDFCAPLFYLSVVYPMPCFFIFQSLAVIPWCSSSALLSFFLSLAFPIFSFSYPLSIPIPRFFHLLMLSFMLSLDGVPLWVVWCCSYPWSFLASLHFFSVPLATLLSQYALDLFASFSCSEHSMDCFHSLTFLR